MFPPTDRTRAVTIATIQSEKEGPGSMESYADVFAQTNFTAFDWGIVILYLVLSVGIGVLANKYVGSLSDYIVAGRGMRTALGIATLTGTEMGLVTVMYSAQKGFTGGFAAFHIGIMAGGLAFFIGVTGFIVTRLRREEVLTIPEYYGKRFGKKAQIIGGLMLSLAAFSIWACFSRPAPCLSWALRACPMMAGSSRGS